MRMVRIGLVVGVIGWTGGCSGPFDQSFADLAPPLQSIRYVRSDSPVDPSNSASVTLFIGHWNGCMVGGNRCPGSGGSSEYQVTLTRTSQNAFDVANMSVIRSIPVNADVTMSVFDGAFGPEATFHGDLLVNSVKLPVIGGAFHFYETGNGIVIAGQGQ